ncbi:MAG: hypothetical protein ACO3JL_16410 [Myxococcota bacterium]
MNMLDLASSLLVVVAAGVYLIWHLALRRRAPSCCPPAKPPSVPPRVVVHANLQRALERAQRRTPPLCNDDSTMATSR